MKKSWWKILTVALLVYVVIAGLLMEAPRLVPSATHCLLPDGLLDRLGRRGLFLKLFFWGHHALIGRQALERNQGWKSPNFAPVFKTYLGLDPHRTLARVGPKQVSAREVARLFMGELWAMLDSAQKTESGIPQEMLDRKKEEMSSGSRKKEVNDHGGKMEVPSQRS